jgi:hypothetical protein
MAQILRNRIEIEQELILETGCDEAISSDSESELEEDTLAVSDNNNAIGSQDKIWSRPQHVLNSDGVHSFVGVFSGLKTQDVPHVNKDSSLITIFFSSSWT